jgi:hypothetical protein
MLGASTSPEVLEQLPQARSLHIAATLPVAGLIGFAGGWIFALSLLKRWGRPYFLSLLILFLMSSAALTFGSLGAAQYWQGFNESGIPGIGHGVAAGRIETFADGIFYVHQADPLLLQSVYVRNRGDGGRFISQVYYDAEDESLLFPGWSLAVQDITSSARGKIDDPGIMDQVYSWSQSVARVFLLYGKELSFRLVALALAVSLFALGGWTFQRGRAWPFLGPFYGIIQFALGMFILQLFQSTEVRGLFLEFFQIRSLGYVGPGILAAAGLILLIIGVFVHETGSEPAAANRRGSGGRNV